VVGRIGIVLKTLRRLVRSKSLNPIRWYFMSAREFALLSFGLAERRLRLGRTWREATRWIRNISNAPTDLSDHDCAAYFDPIYLTGANGEPSDWLKPYLPQRGCRKAPDGGSNRTASAGERRPMITYDSDARERTASILRTDIADFILRYASKPANPNRRTLFLFAGGMGSQLLRARDALSG
jgi:hypothetical protein